MCTLISENNRVINKQLTLRHEQLFGFLDKITFVVDGVARRERTRTAFAINIFL